ncbi:MCE family protein [Nonomuraea sp. NPDC050310]|uniref:MCE family protein n=1 Tax=Nonomuraea sp. NPDC050310 TaxID=3154935 RepID=UPI0033DED1DB
MNRAGGTLAVALKLGLFVMLTGACVATLAVTISGVRFVAATTYRAVFTDAGGIAPGDEVRIAGVRVGRVETVALDARARAEVAFTVQERHRLPSGVVAAIRWRDLAGGRYLALSTGRGGPGHLPPERPITDTRPALDVHALFNGFRPLLRAVDPTQVNRLSWEIVQVLQGEGGTVESLLGHIGSLTGTLADRDAVIGRVIDNLTVVLGEVAGREQQYGKLVDDLHALVDGLAGDRKAIGGALESLDRLTGVTAGFLGRARPDVKAGLAHAGNVLERLDADSELVERAIQELPLRLNQLTRASAYGSWFNFYLCSLQAPPAGVRAGNASARCSAG